MCGKKRSESSEERVKYRQVEEEECRGGRELRKEKKRNKKDPTRCPPGEWWVKKSVCLCVCVHMAAASNIYKEAAVPLATAIVSNYILVSLDTRTYTAYVHTNTQTLPLQPTKKSLPCRLTRGGTWSDANTVSVCMCVLITVS